MVAMSESDDDDLSNMRSVKCRKQLKKTIKNKIEDSDSSSDEKIELSNNNSQIKTNKNKIEDDESSSDEKTELSNSNSYTGKNNDSFCENSDNHLCSDNHGESSNIKTNYSNNIDSSINDSISRLPDISNSHIDTDNDGNSKIIGKDSDSNSEHSDVEKSVNKILQKKKDRNKSKLRCFADSSSDEDSVETNTIPKQRSRKSERMNIKKSSFRSKLDKVKITKEVNEATNANHSDDAKGKEEEEEEETSHSNIADEMVDDVVDVSEVLKNNDLFDMEDSASDEENKSKSKKTSVNSDNDEVMNKSLHNEDENEIRNDGSGDELLMDKKKKGGKHTSKDAMKEAKSEQQRLLRQQKFRLPYHIPEVKPLKDFLHRVPVIKTSKEKKKERASKETITIGEDNEVVDKGDSKLNQGIDSLFKQKPKLSFGNEETIEFVESIEFEDVQSNETSKKKKGVLDSFMARFDKHTRNRRKDLQNKNGSSTNPVIVNDAVSTKDDDKLPGGRRVAFKEHMRQKIKKERCEVLKEVEKEMKLYNEESTSEEDNGSDVDEDDESDDDEENGDEDGNAGAGDGGGSSNDEELSKWNLDDEQKALELEMGEGEKSREIGENSINSVDFSIESRKTVHTERQEKDDLMQWDDSSSTVSSVLPAGQGDPTVGRKNSCDGGRMTPFSKLSKSVLLDSASKQNDNSSSNHGAAAAVSLPCEDTQDLYKDISAPARQLDEEESESVFDNFRLFLNEESQYTQAVDSQGFLNDSKKSKRQPAKRLFDEDAKDGVNDFSQVIGLCSGKFDDDNCTSSVGDGCASNKDEVHRVCKSSSNELSMSQVIGLCSGKFSDDDTMASTKINLTSKSNVVCNENDEGSLSNPPMEHPFSSRIHTDDKQDNKQSADSQIFNNESQFVDTPENIFASDVVHPNLNKPSCISDIIDDNFDDNAIDFCTAPFSTQSTNKVCEAEGGTQELDDDDLLPETKFDVGNWLKGDKQIDEKESESRSSDSSNDIGGIGKTTRKQRIVDSDEDNEDDVFDDKVDKDNLGHDKDEEEDNYEGEEDEVNDKEDVEDVTGSEKEDVEDYDEDEVNDELLEYQDAIALKRKKWSKNAFTEKEAELSGSDVNSDDEELGSEYDEYEVDSDIENLPDAEKLKRQVQKLHQRELIVNDQQDLRILQERFLADGDLGGGKKRQRNFKWKNLDDDDSNFKATTHSGDEEDELNLDGNISQKLERAEREKYIYELQESQKTIMDENSQSMLEMIKDPASIVTEKSMQKLKTKLVSKVEGRVLSQKQLGSFISQKKSSLSHLSSAAKAGGGQGSKAFVFQATEEEKKLSVDKENKARKAPTPISGPARKRVKVSNDVEATSQSIFDLLFV